MTENRKYDWLIATLAVFVFFLVINRMIVMRQGFPVWDADSQAAPWQMLVADHARAGQFLQWNPWTSCGSPDFAEPQIGAFSPVTFFIGLLTGGVYSGFLLYWLTIWLLGGIGIILLARHLRAPPWGGFIGAMGYLFSGFCTGHSEHMSHLHAIAWVPFIIWRLDVGLKEKRLLPALQAGAIWGLSALAGYPGLVMLSGGFAFLWTLGRVLFGWTETEQAEPTRKAKAPAAFLSLILFGCVGLVVLLPTYAGFLVECQGFSDRVGQLSREMATTNALHPGALTTFASPYMTTLYLYNQPGLWSYTDASSLSVYVGPLVTCLALLALAAKPKDKMRWWLAGIALFSILLALARALPFHAWLYAALPLMRFFRHAAIFRDFAILSVIILALLGSRNLKELIEDEKQKLAKSFLLLTVVAATCAATAYAVMTASVENVGDQPLLSAVHIVISWGGTCLAALLVIKQKTTALRPQFVLFFILALAVCDACFALTLTHHTVFTRDPELRREWDKLDNNRSASLDLTSGKMARLPAIGLGPGITNKNLPGKIPVFLGYTAIKNRFHEEWARTSGLKSLAIRRNRTWFSAEAATITPSMTAFELFKKRAIAEKALPMLIHEPDALKTKSNEQAGDTLDSTAETAITNAPLSSRIPVDLVSYKPELLHFSVDCPSAGWLLVTDRWAPGWSATVNGQPAKVWGGTFIFRAVQVKEGKNDVRFNYRPFGYPWLLIASWATLALVLGISVAAALSDKSDGSDLSDF